MADLVRHLIAGRSELSRVSISILPEIQDIDCARAQLRHLNPDLVVLGQINTTEFSSLVAESCGRVLILSPDLKHIRATGEREDTELTPETLTAALLDAVVSYGHSR